MTPLSFPEAVDLALRQIHPHHLRAALGELTARYRAAERMTGPLMTTDAHRLAYLLGRAPATYAAGLAVMAEARAREGTFRPGSLLDLGAGAGAAAWAAVEIFPTIREATLTDADDPMLHLGRQIARHAGAALAGAHWSRTPLTDAAGGGPAAARTAGAGTADLVVMSYVLNELTLEAALAAVEQAWRSTLGLLVLIEPGSRAGFAMIRAARARLIELGAGVAAPCTHAMDCPIADPDWCHFSTRFRRSARHRAVAGGGMEHDDEKYSYVVASRRTMEGPRPAGRIVRVPLRRQGHVILDLCQEGEIRRTTISKKHGPLHRAAREANWGDPWPGGPA